MNEIKNITVIGSGIMGSGIAHSIFKYGLDVTLYDLNKEELENSYNQIKSKARRSMNPDKVHMATTLKSALKNCDLVIEAVYEDLEVKCDLFRTLGEIAESRTIFASNTSSLSISKMANASGRPDRFLGLHFFNPPLIMRLVEMIVHPDIDKDVPVIIRSFIKAIKKQPVTCKESPGFIVNRILLPFINEAFYLLEKRMENQDEIVSANIIDSAIVEKGILLMGPYNLADLTGIDTIYHVSNIIYEGFDKNPRYEPCPLIEKHFRAGHYGRKCGRGIYFYGNHLNDPDLNPALDSKGASIIPEKSSDFNTLNLVSVIVNEALRVVEEGIVNDFNEIELSMELGTRWPKGPFCLARELGLETVHNYLLKLYKLSDNSPRYKPSNLFSNLPVDLKEYFNTC